MTGVKLLLDFVNQAAERPVFLVGAERSGSTLLRLMLSHHPQLAFHFESGFVVQPFLAGHEEPTGGQLRNYQDWLRISTAFKASGFAIDESLPYRELVRSFLRQKAVLTGKPFTGMTIHHGFEHLPKIWPDARYIYLLRDGRDVSHSMMRMGWYGNAWAATERWKQAIASYDKLTSLVPAKNLIKVRFENLASDSQAELMRISNFIGIPYDDAFFDYAKTSSYSLPGQKKAANWRDHMDQHAIRLVEAEIGGLLQRFGYELSGLDHIEITAKLREQLMRENTRLRRKWRINRYGFWNIAFNKIADKLSLATLKEATHSRMSKISRDHLK